MVEAIVAVGLLAGALASLAQMLAMCIVTNRSARAGSDATVLAQQKIEKRDLPESAESVRNEFAPVARDPNMFSHLNSHRGKR